MDILADELLQQLRVTVVIPTYNEAENVPLISEALQPAVAAISTPSIDCG